MCAGPCAELRPVGPSLSEQSWVVSDYDLDLTLGCGQVFRWRQYGSLWRGVVNGRWVELQSGAAGLQARTVPPVSSWDWLAEYLQVHLRLEAVLATFPEDTRLQAAVARWRGLRLLRQPAWECLASFLLSSSKRIEQIQQVIERLCRHWGDPISVPAGHPPAWSFPGPERLATARERDLRRCGMGFRASYLIEAARAVVDGSLDLAALRRQPYAAARAALLALKGVGPKVADCVCLFGLGFFEAFPVDTWVARVLREQYFGGRPIAPEKLTEFGRRYFGPFAGYAQQYLFHDRRTAGKGPVRTESPAVGRGS